ncbi:MAG: hypothetical protein KAT01_11100 [Candidatus Aminicenantes bacterium]|nr:hypothetical protein [Candidatus Aminicenantes bacterium]
MDAYLSKEASSSLEALNIVRGDQDGLLLGHLRGHRFFVEQIFPTQKGFFSSQKQYLSLNQHFCDRVIGFFSFNPDERRAKKILAPLTQGKLYLSIHSQGDDTLDIRSFRIDYKDRFYLSPIRLKS